MFSAISYYFRMPQTEKDPVKAQDMRSTHRVFDTILRTTTEEIGKSLGDTEVTIQFMGSREYILQL